MNRVAEAWQELGLDVAQLRNALTSLVCRDRRGWGRGENWRGGGIEMGFEFERRV
jgi:hypothetical protein